jgi:hypothetical protein
MEYVATIFLIMLNEDIKKIIGYRRNLDYNNSKKFINLIGKCPIKCFKYKWDLA